MKLWAGYVLGDHGLSDATYRQVWTLIVSQGVASSSSAESDSLDEAAWCVVSPSVHVHG